MPLKKTETTIIQLCNYHETSNYHPTIIQLLWLPCFFHMFFHWTVAEPENPTRFRKPLWALWSSARGPRSRNNLGYHLTQYGHVPRCFQSFQYYMLEHDHMINIEKNKINQMFDPMFEMVMFYWYKDIETISNLHWVVIGHNWCHLHPIFPLGTRRTLRPPRVPSVVWTPSTGTSQLYRFHRLHPAAPGHVLRYPLVI